LHDPKISTCRFREVVPGDGRLRLCGAGGIVFGRCCEARERRSGEILIKVVDLQALEGRNPWEYPAVGVLIPRWLQGTRMRGKAQESRPVKRLVRLAGG
jgi:hypothetical protein